MSKEKEILFEVEGPEGWTKGTEVKGFLGIKSEISAEDVERIRKEWRKSTKGTKAFRTPIIKDNETWLPMDLPEYDSIIDELEKL